MQTSTNANKPVPTPVVGVHHHPYDFGAALVRAFPGKTIVLGYSDAKLSFKEDFLDQLTPENATYWNCHCCHHFFNKYAGLQALVYETDENDQIVGSLHHVPALWTVSDDVPTKLVGAYHHLRSKVMNAKWVMPFCNELNRADVKYGYSADRIGLKDKGGYEHWHFSLDGVRNFDVYGESKIAVLAKIENFSKRAEDWLSQLHSVEEIQTKFSMATTLLELSGKASQRVGDKVKTIDALKTFLLYCKAHSVAVAMALLTTSQFMRIQHLSSSVIGEYLRSLLIHRGDPQQCVAMFVKMTDPEYYQRAQKEASDQDLKNLRKMLVEKGYKNPFDWTWVTPEDKILDYRFPVTTSVDVDDVGDSGLGAIDRLLKGREESKVMTEVAAQRRCSQKEFLTDWLHRVKDAYVPSNTFYRHAMPVTMLLKLCSVVDGPLPVKSRTVAERTFMMFKNPTRAEYYGVNASQDLPLVGVTTLENGSKHFVFEGTLTDALAKSVSAPLFAETYNGDFHPHRRALEQLMDVVKPSGEVGQKVWLAIPHFRELPVIATVDGIKTRFTILFTD